MSAASPPTGVMNVNVCVASTVALLPGDGVAGHAVTVTPTP
ncbi:hypothetical protein C8D88_1011759 [Lentzea atacamensis]|uniref:Uncharacterized protein n=1 Tax=Lentzea atacamensis TaxID=531938 RepID=A0A316IG73_9PSEU|nr:hypothetical protein [Lentzea atacamensis]PWK91720.1 hypothetical protein C8D88_1011759 [Lentzea atacamensis]